MIIFNRIIPFKGFNAMNLFGIIFVRKGGVVNKVVLNHERIHTRQQIEMLILPFYLWYVVEWLIRLIIFRDFLKAYRTISFEREAFDHEADLDYLSHRRLWAWIKQV